MEKLGLPKFPTIPAVLPEGFYMLQHPLIRPPIRLHLNPCILNSQVSHDTVISTTMPPNMLISDHSSTQYQHQKQPFQSTAMPPTVTSDHSYLAPSSQNQHHPNPLQSPAMPPNMTSAHSYLAPSSQNPQHRHPLQSDHFARTSQYQHSSQSPAAMPPDMTAGPSTVDASFVANHFEGTQSRQHNNISGSSNLVCNFSLPDSPSGSLDFSSEDFDISFQYS